MLKAKKDILMVLLVINDTEITHLNMKRNFFNDITWGKTVIPDFD